MQTHLGSEGSTAAAFETSHSRSIAIIVRESAMTEGGGGGSWDNEWRAKRRNNRGTFIRPLLWYPNCASFVRARAVAMYTSLDGSKPFHSTRHRIVSWVLGWNTLWITPKVWENGRLSKSVLGGNFLMYRWRISRKIFGVGSMTARWERVCRQNRGDADASCSVPWTITALPPVTSMQLMRVSNQPPTIWIGSVSFSVIVARYSRAEERTGPSTDVWSVHKTQRKSKGRTTACCCSVCGSNLVCRTL